MKKILYIFIAALCFTACENNEPSNSTVKGEYIDLGLPSGTKWNTINETKSSESNGLYRYAEAIRLFEENIPTNAQWLELKDECTWTWKDSVGYEIVGPNGKSIILHAEGMDKGKGYLGAGERGSYWSSDKGEAPLGWRFMYLRINSSEFIFFDYDDYQYIGCSVRLIENP